MSIFNDNFNDTIKLNINLQRDVFIDSVLLLKNTSLNALFEIEISNNLNQTASNITWAFDTGNNYIMDSAMDISLYSLKKGYIYIDYNYSSHGSYETIANITYDGITDTYYLNITI